MEPKWLPGRSFRVGTVSRSFPDKIRKRLLLFDWMSR